MTKRFYLDSVSPIDDDKVYYANTLNDVVIKASKQKRKRNKNISDDIYNFSYPFDMNVRAWNDKTLHDKYEQTRKNIRNQELLKEAKTIAEQSEQNGYPIYDSNDNVIGYRNYFRPQEKPLSGTDPLGEFYVSTVALNPAFKLAGRALQYPLAKIGNQTARNAIMARKFEYAADKAFGFEGTKPVTALGSNLLYEAENPNSGLIIKPTSSEIPTPRWQGFEYTLKNQPKANMQTPRISGAELSGKPKGIRNQPITTNPTAGYESQMSDNFYLINRTNTPFAFDKDGNLIWMPGKGRAGSGRNTVHFTTDRSVQSHMNGDWTGVSETALFPYKQVVADNGLPINIDPMDTYFPMSAPFKLRQQGAKIFTGSKANYLRYKRAGVDAYTTPRAQKIQEKLAKLRESQPEVTDASFIVGTPEYNALNAYYKALGKYKGAYDQEQLNWLRQYSNPTIQDYKTLEAETGLTSGVNELQGVSYGSDPLRKVNYYDTPASHSSSWYGSSEIDEVAPSKTAESILRMFNPRLQKLNGYTIPSRQEFPLIERFFKRNPTLYDNVPLSKFDKILSGELTPEQRWLYTLLRNIKTYR